MRVALSTNWNCHRHETADSMLEEICSMGFDSVELGYGTTQTQIDGLRKWLDSGAIKVTSVHAFCPNFVFGGSGPEVYSLCDIDDKGRTRRGLEAAKVCADFAASVGASTVVMHAGRVPIARHIRALDSLADRDLLGSPKHDKQTLKIMIKRDKAVGKHLDALYESLEEVLPRYKAQNVTLALENLPTCDAIPNEIEMAELLREFNDMPLKYWHDLGHGQIRQNFGFSYHRAIVSSFKQNIAGFHVHDVTFPDNDHQAPHPGGTVDFKMLASFAPSPIPFVLEPSKKVDKASLIEGLAYLRQTCEI